MVNILRYSITLSILIFAALIFNSLSPLPVNALEKTITNSIGMEFVLIPGGTCTMVSPADGSRCEVTIKPFLICRTECTQKAWDSVGGHDIRQWKGSNLPIERADWNDCKEWCAKAGLRLPTEPEWEYACRAGTSTPYYFGSSSSDLENYAWYKDNSQGRTHPVGMKISNAFGLFDLYGNLWEWCEDAWHEGYSKIPADGTARGDPNATHRCARGGSWEGEARYCSSSWRDSFRAGLNDSSLGFRPAASLVDIF